MAKKKTEEVLPEYLDDQEMMHKLTMIIENTAHAIVRRQMLVPAYDFVRKNKDMLTRIERGMWKDNHKEMKEFMVTARESYTKAKADADLIRKAEEKAKKEREDD